jgi:subtilisin
MLLVGRLVALSALLLVFALPSAASAAKPIPDQYIVVLADGTDAKAVAAEHRRNAGAQVLDTYGAAVDGYTARLSASELRRVKADRRVEYVTQDLQGDPLGAQTLPTGINRVDADVSSALAGNGSGATPGDVAVYDTGIQTTHPDLNVAGGVNCLGALNERNDGTIDDGFGHGTHIAGTIGAKDDSNGVVGVAPGVRLWSVRVNDAWGTSTSSMQLCGIDWLTRNGPALGIKVVNASQTLIGSTDDGNCGQTSNDVLHQAVCASTAAGLTWVFAAMNSNSEFQSNGGAGYGEVLTVTAMADSNGQPNVGSTATFSCKSVLKTNGSNTTSGVDDTQASFSNWTSNPADQQHTIAAPGVCIWSTFKGSSYGYWSGTSMATPHAVGAVHLCIVSGQCTGGPAETIQKVRTDAQAYTQANPGFGFRGDPLRPVTGRYYGYLIRAGLY